MTANEFDTFISTYGKDILRYCRMITGSSLEGDDLYQDTMLTLLEQQEKLDFNQNMKSYALSVSNLIWKNRKRKFAWRKRIAPLDSYELHIQSGNDFSDTGEPAGNPENSVLQNEQIQIVRDMVAALPEKYRMVIYLYYSANLTVREIVSCLGLPEGTVKSRLRKAKKILKQELEVVEYDR